MTEQRDFKGVWIPKAIWLDESLNALDKIILAEIDSLDKGSGCWASNQYIANFCQCSSTKVSTSISKLIKLGYLSVESFDGRTRNLKSSLSVFESLPFKNCKAALQDLKETNIEINTDTNTKKERKKESYETIIDEFTKSEALKNALYEFIKMRKLIKRPLTDRALSLLIGRLKELGKTEAVQIAILNQSIINNWQSVYPLKNNGNVGANGIKLTDDDGILDGIL